MLCVGEPASQNRCDSNEVANCAEFLKFPHFSSPGPLDKLKFLRKDAVLKLENEDQGKQKKRQKALCWGGTNGCMV